MSFPILFQCRHTTVREGIPNVSLPIASDLCQDPAAMTASTSQPNVSGNSLSGHLHLECEVRSDGTPFISRQDFRAPIHLSKSHLDAGCVIQTIVNPTAGFFDGDLLRTAIVVKDQARLVLSTPSASRVYPTRSGKPASNHQTFTVGGRGSLEWIPEPFIPHAGAAYFQRTDIHLEKDASLLFFDWIAPGRVACGEIFAYQNLRWELDLHLAGELIARERYDLDPATCSLEALKAKFPAAHYLSIYAAGDFSKNWPAAELDALNGADVYLGHGPLLRGPHVVRALCRDSLAARNLLQNLRTLLYSAAGRPAPKLGRIFM
jgi:urease accessory protein